VIPIPTLEILFLIILVTYMCYPQQLQMSRLSTLKELVLQVLSWRNNWTIPSHHFLMISSCYELLKTLPRHFNQLANYSLVSKHSLLNVFAWFRMMLGFYFKVSIVEHWSHDSSPCICMIRCHTPNGCCTIHLWKGCKWWSSHCIGFGTKMIVVVVSNEVWLIYSSECQMDYSVNF